MDTTTILPTPPTSGAIVQSSGNGNNYDACVAELITNNNIADNSRAILTAIANGDAAIIAADQAGHLVNQKSTYDAQVAGLNATNLNGNSNLKATGDASVANLKATYDAQVAGINATNLGAVSATKAVTDSGLANLTSTERNAGENRLQTAIASGEIRELINKSGFDNLVAIKDNGFAIREEGCKTRELVLIESHKTREKEAEHFAALQLQACINKNDIEKEMLKGFSNTQLEALKNKEELARQIAKCCCEGELREAQTQALIIKQSAEATKDELQETRFEILALKNRHHDKH